MSSPNPRCLGLWRIWSVIGCCWILSQLSQGPVATSCWYNPLSWIGLKGRLLWVSVMSFQSPSPDRPSPAFTMRFPHLGHGGPRMTPWLSLCYSYYTRIRGDQWVPSKSYLNTALLTQLHCPLLVHCTEASYRVITGREMKAQRGKLRTYMSDSFSLLLCLPSSYSQRRDKKNRLSSFLCIKSSFYPANEPHGMAVKAENLSDSRLYSIV